MATNGKVIPMGPARAKKATKVKGLRERATESFKKLDPEGRRFVRQQERFRSQTEKSLTKELASAWKDPKKFRRAEERAVTRQMWRQKVEAKPEATSRLLRDVMRAPAKSSRLASAARVAGRVAGPIGAVLTAHQVAEVGARTMERRIRPHLELAGRMEAQTTRRRKETARILGTLGRKK